MDNPQLIPDSNIEVNDEVAPENIADIRPDSRNPFRVTTNTVTIRFIFENITPLASISLPTSTNVASMTVTFVQPGPRRRPVVRVQVSRMFVVLYYSLKD
jgi:hypothetical protein